MAKKSMIARDEKRKKMIVKYATKRAELKELGAKTEKTMPELHEPKLM